MHSVPEEGKTRSKLVPFVSILNTQYIIAFENKVGSKGQTSLRKLV